MRKPITPILIAITVIESAMVTACGGSECENLCEDLQDCPDADKSVDWDCEKECEEIQKLVDNSRPEAAACQTDRKDPCCRLCIEAPGGVGLDGMPCLDNTADTVCSTALTDGCQSEYDQLMSCASQADDACNVGCDGQIATFNLCMCQSQLPDERPALCAM